MILIDLDAKALKKKEKKPKIEFIIYDRTFLKWLFPVNVKLDSL